MGTISTPSAKQVMLAGFLPKFSGLTPDKDWCRQGFSLFSYSWTSSQNILIDTWKNYGASWSFLPHKEHQTEIWHIIFSLPLIRSWEKSNKHCETKQKSYFHYHLSWTCKLKDLENDKWLKTKIVLKDD